MSRLRRFPDNRFVGRRDEMVVYDCDDSNQFAEIEAAVGELSLDIRNQLQAFAPDSLLEATNRGFQRVRLRGEGFGDSVWEAHG